MRRLRNPYTGRFVSQRTYLENIITELDADMKLEFRAERYAMAKALMKDKAVYVAILHGLPA